jgi:hypothetical protein
MTAATATWAIPYATGTDPLCDGAEITQAMAERVDAILGAFDDDLEFLHNIPAARVELSVAATQAETAGCTSPFGVFWDTVDYDTANMVNLAVDRAIITMTRAGYFGFGGSAQFLIPPATSGDVYSMSIFSTVPVNAVNGNAARDSSNNAELSSSGLNQVNAANLILGAEAELDMEICRFGTTGSSDATIIESSHMYAHWYADL